MIISLTIECHHHHEVMSDQVLSGRHSLINILKNYIDLSIHKSLGNTCLDR
jgi:hypothetical protein